MLCTIMLPSRKRPEKLTRMIESVFHCATGRNWEILVRVDDDDDSWHNVRRRYPFCIRFLVGPRYKGYNSLEEHFYTELEAAAQGDWVWHFNDDFVIQGANWDGKLAQVPLEGYFVGPEVHKLGRSTYEHNTGNEPCWPRNAWKRWVDKAPQARDACIPQLFLSKGWRVWWLPGIAVWHDRADDGILKQEHAM